MSHKQVECQTERIELFLHQQLSDNEQADFERHLDDCDECCTRLEQSAAAEDVWTSIRESLHEEGLSLDSEDCSGSSMDSATSEAGPPFSVESVLQLLAPTDDDRMLGRLGTYEVIGIIGTGGMGVVLKAFDPALNRYVAIKILSPHLGNSGAARKRFSREAQAAAAVVHDNVIEIHGVADANGLPYLVMPYVRGPSLQKRLDDDGPLSVVEMLRIARQAAAGLAAAHAQGLVHRDVKPANILLADGIERVKLTDFGLARAADDASLTKTGVIAGTPQYMSPEQARGDGIDATSDLFSLGSVMYTMCTGRPPFRAETSYGILRRITDTEPRPIREVNPEIPEWLCGIIAKLMAKSPDDRFESASEVAELLEDCLAHVQQPATVPLPPSCLSLVERSKNDQPAGTKPSFSRKPPANVMWLIAGAAFTLIFAGILIVLELNKGTLTIESEADDVPIRIMQGDKVVDAMTVTHSGKTIRIAAGKYVVEVLNSHDGIVVDGGSVSLMRGETQTVKIVKNDELSPKDSGSTTTEGEKVPGTADSSRAELPKLLGTWVRAGTEGKPKPETITFRDLGVLWVRFTDHEGIVREGTAYLGSGRLASQISIDVLTGQDTRSFWRGTYALEGDTLKLNLDSIEILGEASATRQAVRLHRLYRRVPQESETVGEQETAPGTVDSSASPLLTAVGEFNERQRRDSVGQNQPPLTGDEVIAAIRAAIINRDPVALNAFQDFQQIAEAGRWPAGWCLEIVKEIQLADGGKVDVWAVVLKGGKGIAWFGPAPTRPIRERPLKYWPREPEEEPGDVAEGRVELRELVNAFNQRMATAVMPEDAVGRTPPITVDGVVAAIRLHIDRHTESLSETARNELETIATTRTAPSGSELDRQAGYHAGRFQFVTVGCVLKVPAMKEGAADEVNVQGRFVEAKNIARETEQGEKVPRTVDRSVNQRRQENAEQHAPVTPNADVERLQGVWTMGLCDSATEGFGDKQAVVRDWRWDFRGNEITWARSHGEVWKMKFTVDQTKTPKEIDLTYLDGPHKQKKSLGRYRWGGLDGKTLQISVQDPGADVPRPKSIGMRSYESSLIFLERPNADKELASLQGKWKLEIFYTDALPKPTGNYVGREWVIKGNEMSWTGPNGAQIRMSFTIDPTKLPHEIDATFRSGPLKDDFSSPLLDGKCLGMYERRGDTLWLCFADPGSKAPRPKNVSYVTNEGSSMIGLSRTARADDASQGENVPGTADSSKAPGLSDFERVHFGMRIDQCAKCHDDSAKWDKAHEGLKDQFRSNTCTHCHSRFELMAGEEVPGSDGSVEAGRTLRAFGKAPATVKAGASLLEAVREFNKRQKVHEIGKDQPPLTDDEVIAAIRDLRDDRDEIELSDLDFAAFQGIAETGMLPRGWAIDTLREVEFADGGKVDVWSVVLTYKRPRGNIPPNRIPPDFTHTIRQRALKYRPNEKERETKSESTGPPTSSGISLQGSSMRVVVREGGEPESLDGRVSLAKLVFEFNSQWLSTTSEETPESKAFPGIGPSVQVPTEHPLTFDEVMAAIQLQLNRPSVKKRPGDAAFREELQRITDTQTVPEGTKLDSNMGYNGPDLEFDIRGCYLKIPSTAEGVVAWTAPVRRRFIGSTPVVKTKDDEIAWGPPAADGLQVGVQLARISGGGSPGATYSTKFFFRNRSGKTIAAFEHQIDNFDIDARTPTGDKLLVKNRTGTARISIPIFPVEVTGGKRIAKPGLPILLGGFTAQKFEEAAFLETSDPFTGDAPVAVVNARIGESIRIRFQLLHPANIEGPKLTTGEIRVNVGEDAEIGSSHAEERVRATVNTSAVFQGETIDQWLTAMKEKWYHDGVSAVEALRGDASPTLTPTRRSLPCDSCAIRLTQRGVRSTSR